MSSILDNKNNKIKCQKFTPENLAEFMLDEAEYKTDLYGKKVLENSFGEGNIILPIVKRYIEDCINHGYSLNEISYGLHNDIYGIELDKNIYSKCIASLNDLIKMYGIKKVNWNLKNCDFLSWNANLKFDYIIGNPPYITYRDIDSNNRNYLKSNFECCNKGKFDYCYAFIEKAVKLLNKSGKLVQLVPSNIYKNVFANKLREMLKSYISKIYDYPNQKCFISALTTSTIFVYDKAYTNDYVLYSNVTNFEQNRIPKSRLKDKWVFEDINIEEEGNIRFGDVFNASVTIATLYNDAFIVEPQTIIDNAIEKNIIRETTSPKFERYNKNYKIIFPYSYRNGKLKRYTNEYFEENFPNAYAYLNKFREKLDNRCKDQNSKWFEYGRSQALSHLNQDKLLISTIVTNEVSVYRLGKRVIPYSGIYITSKNAGFTLDDAERILNSESFYNYIMKIGVNINGKSVRISCKDINEYRF